MSHALLLRLFLSPSFFSVHVALQYLKQYSDNIGITYYLTNRLRGYDANELRQVWGLICHLLVTKPSKSRALECFVIEICERSTHVAMVTLWLMQATLNDLATTRHDTPSFAICQRVLHKCHEIIFGELPSAAPTPYSNLSVMSTFRLPRKKVKAQVEPMLVGLGVVMAGAPGLPRLTEVVGEVAIEQGRVDDDGQETRGYGSTEEDLASSSPLASRLDLDDEDGAGSDLDSPATTPIVTDSKMKHASTLPSQEALLFESLQSRRTMSASQTSPALHLHLINVRRSRNSDDPLGQQDVPALRSPTHTPSQSSPSLSAIQRTPRGNPADTLLQSYHPAAQMHLLRSHFCRSEVHFLLTLEDISNRLLVIPRPARVSALRAELTALNHKLPAEVCMPMWCPSTDATASSKVPQAHHRIVRIPPGESVVLNSAERAPYVLLLEILNGDLDFDPLKRSNKDVLRKIIEKENERKGASNELAAFQKRDHTKPLIEAPVSVDSQDVIGNGSGDEALAEPSVVVTESPTQSLQAQEEEVDLVEQLYGAGQSIRSRPVDLNDSLVLPSAPRNRDIDVATWSHPSTPILGAQQRTGPSSSGSRQGGAVPETSLPPPVMSLDEYSERMRTAAVMLAQLKTSLVRDSTVQTGPVSIPGASRPTETGGWSKLFTVTAPEDDSAPKGPIHPSLSGSLDASPAPVPGTSKIPSSRSKLQPAEAAAIRERIMKEMLALEEERMSRMQENRGGDAYVALSDTRSGTLKSTEDAAIIKRELNKADPSAVVFSESWAAKKARIRQASPYGHLASWDCVSVIVKTGGDLRQEQFATQLIQEFGHIWKEENCACWVRTFQILITGATSAIVETITDAVSIHSIKKAEYARRFAVGELGHVTLLDHFKNTYGDVGSAKFARAQRNFAKSLAGYSIVTFLLQIKDRHNGNILLDRDGHLVHIDFGFMLSNSPGNIGFEAAPFKLPMEYIEVLGGVDSEQFREFRTTFREGFEAARKHCDRLITMVELMQKDSSFPCFVALGEQTATQLKDRFQPTLTHNAVGEYVDRLIDTSLGSHWTRLYDSFQYYSQSIL